MPLSNLSNSTEFLHRLAQRRRLDRFMPWMILVCLALIIAGGAVLFFEKLRQNDTRVIEQNLSAIANLKSDQINGWLSRNGTNIEVVATSSLIAERVGKWLSHDALAHAGQSKT